MAAKKQSKERKSFEGDPGISCYISYSQSDGRVYASRLQEELQKFDVRVMSSDSDISVGSRWIEALRQHLGHADVIILVGTQGAFTSDWILEEIRYFLDRGRRILPIVFGSIPQLDHIPRFLLEIQWLQEEASALRKGPSKVALGRLLHWVWTEGRRYSSGEALARTLAEKRPLNEGKLILVGRGEVGKTSLVKRLVENNFSGDETTTQGIRITSWFLACEADTFRLNIWDFGGQEIMHATHQFFLTERSLYLLVLNGREGGEDVDAEYWLKHIESFGGESPIIVVQNKVTQHPFDLNYRGLQARYPQIRGFVKTDCKDQLGLSDLRELVKSVVGGMPEVRMQFPTDWFTVKEQLESMDDEYLGYQGFVELCAAEGIESESDRDTLGFVLHCLGIALNYRDDSRLRETSVLKPEWVTHGIYKILNAKKLAERQGELQLKDLQELLPKGRYPIDKHLFLLELMRKFSLCFPFRDEADRYLVPELLGKEEPEEVVTFRPEDCLSFEYHYGLLPEGYCRDSSSERTHSVEVSSDGGREWCSPMKIARRW